MRNQRCLIGLSLTPHDAELLHYVRRLADAGIVGRVHVRHVVRQPEDLVRAEGELRRSVAKYFGAAPPSCELVVDVAAGIRIDELLDAAARGRADFILVGHRRDRSGRRSLANRLAMVAPCSVWLVPEGAPATLRRLLVPVDFSDHSADALGVAASLAAAAGAPECLALHVSFDPSTVRYPEHTAELELEESEAFRRFLSEVDLAGTPVRPRCEQGPEPAATILRVARESDSDLVVMSTRGRSRAAAVLLGSETARVIAEAPMAVLAVKHRGARLGLFDALRDPHFWQPATPKTN